MQPKHLTSSEELAATVKTGVTLVDFGAPWCSPCRAQEPIVQQLAAAFSGRAVVAEMNIDEHQSAAAALGIQSIPTLAPFKNGREVRRFVGLQGPQTLAGAIEAALL